MHRISCTLEVGTRYLFIHIINALLAPPSLILTTCAIFMRSTVDLPEVSVIHLPV